MAKYRTIRVYPDGNVWVVKKDTAAKASAIRNTKDEALKVAREIALNQGLTIIIHGKDGRIQKTVTPEDSEPDSNCFITTSCIKYFGLRDDCYELQTLRKFRDEYLLKNSKNRALVNQYYSIAPNLVKLLELSRNKKELYSKIFSRINSACQAIEAGRLNNAKIIYKDAVLYLIKYFKLT